MGNQAKSKAVTHITHSYGPGAKESGSDKLNGCTSAAEGFPQLPSFSKSNPERHAVNVVGAAADLQQLWLLTFQGEVNRAWPFSRISTSAGTHVREQVVLVTQQAGAHQGSCQPGIVLELAGSLGPASHAEARGAAVLPGRPAANLPAARATVRSSALEGSGLNQLHPCACYLPQCSVSPLPLLPMLWPFSASREGDRARGWRWLSLYCLLSWDSHSVKGKGIFSAPC